MKEYNEKTARSTPGAGLNKPPMISISKGGSFRINKKGAELLDLKTGDRVTVLFDEDADYDHQQDQGIRHSHQQRTMNDLIITAMSKCHEYDGPDFVPERESLAATVSRMKVELRTSVFRDFFNKVYSQSRNADIAAATQLSVHEVTAMARKFSLFKDSRTLTRFTVEELKVILMHTCTKSGY